MAQSSLLVHCPGIDQAHVQRAGAGLAVYIAGADPYVDDRLGRLRMTKPGLLARPILTLTLHTKEGSAHRLEMYSFSQLHRARLQARRIAEYCGIAYLDGSGGDG